MATFQCAVRSCRHPLTPFILTWSVPTLCHACYDVQTSSLFLPPSLLLETDFIGIPSYSNSFLVQGGIRLRKTVTNDKSGLIVDETMKEKSVQLVEPAPSTAYIPPKKDPPKKSVAYQRPKSPYLHAEASDDERWAWRKRNGLRWQIRMNYGRYAIK